MYIGYVLLKIPPRNTCPDTADYMLGLLLRVIAMNSKAIAISRYVCIGTITTLRHQQLWSFDAYSSKMGKPATAVQDHRSDFGLSGQGKSGHAWSLQNRPYGMARDVVLFILLSPDQASLFWFSSFAVRILGCDRGGEDDPAWQ